MPSRSLAAAIAALLLASPARAQDAAAEAETTPRTSLQKGAWSISFLAPVYGGSGQRAEFGAWEMVGPRTNLGLTLRLTVGGSELGNGQQETTQAETSVGLGANVRQYLARPRDVTPYVHAAASVAGDYRRREGTGGYEETERGAAGGAEAALGVEWFPVRRMSVSGHTGFTLFARRWDLHLERPDGEDSDSQGRAMFVNSVTSALTLQIYF